MAATSWNLSNLSSPSPALGEDRPDFSRATEIIDEIYKHIYGAYFDGNYIRYEDGKWLANKLHELIDALNVDEYPFDPDCHYMVTFLGHKVIPISEYREMIMRITKVIWIVGTITRFKWCRIVAYIMGESNIKKDHELMTMLWDILNSSILDIIG